MLYWAFCFVFELINCLLCYVMVSITKCTLSLDDGTHIPITIPIQSAIHTYITSTSVCVSQNDRWNDVFVVIICYAVFFLKLPVVIKSLSFSFSRRCFFLVLFCCVHVQYRTSTVCVSFLFVDHGHAMWCTVQYVQLGRDPWFMIYYITTVPYRVDFIISVHETGLPGA